MTTSEIIDRPSTKHLLSFINQYRSLESASYDVGYTLFRRAFFSANYSKKDLDHMCDKWHHNKKSFGGFFLGSLSYPKHIMLLNYWGIPVFGDKEYLNKCAADHTYGFLNKPPQQVQDFFKMMLFFNNHGINPEPFPGFVLERPASSKHRYGNSANWGRYVLTLEDHDRFFDDLYRLYQG